MDWAGLKRFAFGPLNLMPQQFWELTPADFKELIDGYKWKNEAEWYKIAQLAAWITAPHLKRPTSAKKLLGKNKEKVKTNPEESRQKVVDLVSRLGKGLNVSEVS